jgi:hypothetical protein
MILDRTSLRIVSAIIAVVTIASMVVLLLVPLFL